MIAQRMRRLRGDRPHYSLLALDHGLTFGHSVDAAPLPADELLERCSDHIGGFVMNYGLARALDGWSHRLSLVLQCFGAPQGYSRSQVASVSEAITLDAAAVSVQLSWADTELAQRLREISAFTSEAHSAGLPVLYMINGESETSALRRVIRVCQELGADLVKINCSLDNFMCGSEDIENVVRYGPPILMAGGVVSHNILQLAQNAAQLGFSGYCVGRNIFHAKSPPDVAAQLNVVFTNASKGVDR